MGLSDQEKLRIFLAATGIRRGLYVTPSGEIIEVLQDLASQVRVADIAEAIRSYVAAIGTTDPLPFIAGHLPGIITNRVLPHLAGLDNAGFVSHMLANPADMEAWCEQVVDCARSPAQLHDAVHDLKRRFPA